LSIALAFLPTLLSPARRAAVHHLMQLIGVSERFACRVSGQQRTTQRHGPAETTQDDPDAASRQWLWDYAQAHPVGAPTARIRDDRGRSGGSDHFTGCRHSRVDRYRVASTSCWAG
jgi:hypothetical protein